VHIETLWLTAFSLGLLHALEPGHGKTLMAGTLVGSQRKWLDPISIGVSTAGGHAIGMLAFVSASFFRAHEVAAEKFRHHVELAMGCAVVLISLTLITRVVRARYQRGADRGTSHHSGSSCGCRAHQNKVPLSVVGFLIGIVPCPSAVAICLSATKVGSYTSAILLSGLFALGVAMTISILGVTITHSSGRITQYLMGSEKLSRFMELLSPTIVLILGILMIFHAFGHSP
jgi:ABC-type nickel/cobalt efflux system permease component RcnA